MNARTVRQHMLMAADKIERFPEQFKFIMIRVPVDRDGCGCALGWLGYFASMHDKSVEEVSQALLGIGSGEFYSRMNAMDAKPGYWDICASDCSERLRRYADAYFPNPNHEPDDVNAVPAGKVVAP